MVSGVVVELGPHAQSELLEVWQTLLVLHVLIVQLLVHGHFVYAASVGGVGGLSHVDQGQLVCSEAWPPVQNLQTAAVKIDLAD